MLLARSFAGEALFKYIFGGKGDNSIKIQNFKLEIVCACTDLWIWQLHGCWQDNFMAADKFHYEGLSSGKSLGPWNIT